MSDSSATRLYGHPEDFEAEITIFTADEGGRVTPPRNGIRWNFMYAGDSPEDGIFMIWPEFIDENGNAVPADVPLLGTYQARMHIFSDDLKETVHRKRLSEGTAFFCMEGARKVARGTVTTGMSS